MAIDLKDIYTRLGLTASKYDLGWVNNANNHKNINKWSLNKPMQYNGSDWYKELTAEQKKVLMYGYTIPSATVLTYDTLQGYYSGTKTLPSSWIIAEAEKHLKLGYGWEYKPNTSKFRLTDWQGYDHTIDYLFKVSTMEAQITQGVAITFTYYMQVKLSEFASRFATWYIGLVMWDKSNPTTQRWLKTSTVQVQNSGLTQQITLSATDTEAITAGQYQVGLFVGSAIASTMVGDKSQNYYVSKWTTGNVESLPFTPLNINVVTPPILWSLTSASGAGNTTTKSVTYTVKFTNDGLREQAFDVDSSIILSIYTTNAQQTSETFLQSVTLSKTSAPTAVESGGSGTAVYRGTLPKLLSSVYYIVRVTYSFAGITHSGEGVFVGSAKTFTIS